MNDTAWISCPAMVISPYSRSAGQLDFARVESYDPALAARLYTLVQAWGGLVVITDDDDDESAALYCRGWLTRGGEG